MFKIISDFTAVKVSHSHHNVIGGFSCKCGGSLRGNNGQQSKAKLPVNLLKCKEK